MLAVPLWLWGAFAATVVVSLAVDLLSHRTAHVIRFKEAAAWSSLWVSLALIFGAVVFLVLGTTAGTEYTTAWLLEKSLSVDNLFVFAIIFAYFKVPRAYQHRVLFFGVIGALVFRGIFLSLGVAVVSRFTAVLFVFAAVLFYSTYKLLKGEEESFDPGRSFAVRMLRKLIPVRDEYAGAKFFVKEAGKRMATPLLAVVAAIEAADLIFAVDSVPAVLAVSDDAFIVYTSNAFAILGLRALYFMLAGLLDRFHYLNKGLAIILAFIGVKLILQASHKMISPSIPEIPSPISLAVIVVVLTGSVVLSLRRPSPIVALERAGEQGDAAAATEQPGAPSSPLVVDDPEPSVGSSGRDGEARQLSGRRGGRPLPDPPVRAYRKEMVKMKRESDTYVCPTCEKSVPAAVHRHKTLGVNVPVWGPGACQNRDCPDFRLDPRHKQSSTR
ncbi:tellurite resistance protein TerC [Streptomyces wuyuanensis]|uniref:Tellurite resistance protein TerC n=1 Tax=Streptomyces wuyuanensis TaxID=1196353 RepID=A0A1G9Y9C6_9ACTN|nr:tellurite resistance protein TerC [Streptomyces wuyuanensis]